MNNTANPTNAAKNPSDIEVNGEFLEVLNRLEQVSPVGIHLLKRISTKALVTARLVRFDPAITTGYWLLTDEDNRTVGSAETIWQEGYGIAFMAS
jgi:hypothetical protein